MLVASPSARPSSSTAPDAVVAGRLPAEGPVRLGSVDLPPGRLIAGGAGAGYVAWATVDPVPGSGRVWTALSELHSRTGLVPVHLDGLSGRFFLRCRETRTKPITYDNSVAVRLWNMSQALYESRASAGSRTE